MEAFMMAFLYFLGTFQGLIIGYMLFAPSGTFKQGFLKGMIFDFSKDKSK
jgi:hypothetical protein